MNSYFYTDIPTWSDGRWTKTSFSTREDFRDFVVSVFKPEGPDVGYEFDETSFLFNQEARRYRDNKEIYCEAPYLSKDYLVYWDTQKEKCRKGVIFRNGNKCWYLPRFYYMWINFLPIYDKVKRKYDFPEVWDSQYHTSLYILLAELHYKHSTLLKKRQFGASFLHTGILINELWFEEGPVLKMGASLKDYVNEKGSWRFLTSYRSFLDSHTAWYRPMNPGGKGIWQQQVETTVDGRKTTEGLGGTLQLTTFDKDPTNGVGGGIRWFFHEEFGIAPKADITLEYLLPALKSGDLTTGTFAGSGSVGDLDQCEPLKDCLLNPDAHDMYAVETALLDDKGTRGRTALFIPEQWSMPPYIDEYGNSLVKKALEAIDTQRVIWKKDLRAEIYQLRISQHPKNIYEAFAYRNESIFPLNLLQAQKKRIDDKLYPHEYLDIGKDENGKIIFKKTYKLPIREFPLNKATEDKEGAIVVWEKPFKDNPELAKYYYASIDPVGEGKTTTSESLVSIIIYKLDVEVTKVGQDIETYIEHGKIVASWCGRFDDLNKTHERLQYLVEIYGAWCLCENNISAFITHMIHRKKQHYLVPKTQIMWLKDLGANESVYAEYGWKNTGNLFKTHLLSQGIEFLKEELDAELTTEGKVVKTTYGIERIPDPMLLKEMEEYQPGMNVDRLVSYCSLIAFIKVQQANRGYSKRVELDDSSKKANKELYKADKSFFKTKNINGDSRYNVKKSGFRNLK